MKKIIDGKINHIEYDKASCKILWILKEANISEEDKEKKLIYAGVFAIIGIKKMHCLYQHFER